MLNPLKSSRLGNNPQLKYYRARMSKYAHPLKITSRNHCIKYKEIMS